jgi:hypothetical protein
MCSVLQTISDMSGFPKKLDLLLQPLCNEGTERQNTALNIDRTAIPPQATSVIDHNAVRLPNLTSMALLAVIASSLFRSTPPSTQLRTPELPTGESLRHFTHTILDYYNLL